MRKFESSQKDESRAQSADSSKAYGKRKTFIYSSCVDTFLKFVIMCF